MTKRSLIAIVCALAAVAPSGLPARAEGPQQQLDRLREEIEETEALIEQADEERRGLLAQVAASDARRGVLSDRISALAGDLSRAETVLARVQASFELARTELGRVSDGLRQTRQQLSDQRAQLGERAAAAYRLGPGGLLDVMLGARDFRTLTESVTFVRSVLDADSTLVTSIEVARTQEAGQRDRIGDLTAQLSADRDAVRAEVERIAALKAEREAVAAEIDAEIAVRKGLIADIEAERAKYEKAVAEMRAESERIAGLIQGDGSTGGGNPNADLFWPAPGAITSGFGWREHPIFGTRRFHAGVDIDSECGDPIWSAEGGTVLSAASNGGYGYATVVDHGDGLSTLYAHQAALGVSAGQSVSRGERIGTVGSTGWSTGCHLHFEVRVNGEPVDPAPYLQ